MMIAKDTSIKAKIEEALDEIRPFMEEDGGNVELLEVTDDLVARIAFKGACKTCDMSEMTFRAGVENAIIKAVPEIKKVEAVNLPFTK